MLIGQRKVLKRLASLVASARQAQNLSNAVHVHGVYLYCKAGLQQIAHRWALQQQVQDLQERQLVAGRLLQHTCKFGPTINSISTPCQLFTTLNVQDKGEVQSVNAV